MPLLSRLIDRRIAAYQRELIEIHYAEVENMYRQMRGWRQPHPNDESPRRPGRLGGGGGLSGPA